VLTGIQTAAYGKDIGETFPGLINKIQALPGLDRLRMGSIEPYAIDESFIEAVQASAVCNHFHVSLQSGCNKTLARMNRRYTAKEYARAAGRLREAKPETALTTDIIVGFPGETEADFLESLRFVKEMAFARMHVFEFSARKGTAAASFPGQLPAAVKKERGRAMRKQAHESFLAFASAFLGHSVEVLYESRKNGFWEGHTTNYIAVQAVLDGEDNANKLINTYLTQTKEGEQHEQTIIIGNAESERP
jgi:threonylcarbamoyladenosine tRNA methylthiotransferase MtaB